MMTQTEPRTAWMWLSGDDLRGLSLDRDEGLLAWIWQAGCHCADEDEIVQTAGEFLRDGPPSLMGPLPEDVNHELRQVLAASQ